MHAWLQRTPLRSLPLVALAIILTAACSDDATSAKDAGLHDAGADLARTDARPDAGLDAPSSDGQADPDAAPDSSPDWQAPFDPVVCNAPAHSWLPPQTMGKVVQSQRSLLYSLPKAALQLLIDNTDYKGSVKPLYDVNVYMVRYETQDRGKKVEATMALAFPTLPAGAKTKVPSVLWLHGTTGFNDACAPTAKQGGVEAALPVALMASQGYFSVAPDYIGLAGFGAPATARHAYLVGEQVALGSLDALRAGEKVLAAEQTPVRPDGRLIVWGGSQGGHAALFSTHYAPYYLSDYQVTATVALVPPINLLAQTKAALSSLNKGTTAAAAVMVGQARWYGMETRLAEVLTDVAPNNIASKLPTLMDSECSVSDKDFDIKAVGDVHTTAAINAIVTAGDWKGFEDWRCVLAASSLPDSPVKPKGYPPLLVVVSENDTLVNSSAQRPSFDALCAAGYQAEYLECKGAGHTQGAIWSLTEQFAWVADRLAGKPLTNVCKRGPAVCCSGTDKPCTP